MSLKRLALIVLLGVGIALPATASDVQVEVNEAVLQKFLTTIAPIRDSGEGSVRIPIPYPAFCKIWDWIYLPCIKWTSCGGKYTWNATVSDLDVQILPVGVPFSGNTSTHTSAKICGIPLSLSYAPAVKGLLTVSWQPPEQEIRIAMQTLKIEIYVKLLGHKIHLAWINLASKVRNPLYAQKLEFAQQFALPSPISKQITVTVEDAEVTLFTGFLRFNADLNYTSP